MLISVFVVCTVADGSQERPGCSSCRSCVCAYSSFGPQHSSAYDTCIASFHINPSPCEGFSCHLSLPPPAFVPYVQFQLALCNHTWIVTKHVWAGAKGGYASGFRCGIVRSFNFIQHRTCAHSEGARVESEAFLWQQMCASGAPPHPGPTPPSAEASGSGKESPLGPQKVIMKTKTADQIQQQIRPVQAFDSELRRCASCISGQARRVCWNLDVVY